MRSSCARLVIFLALIICSGYFTEGKRNSGAKIGGLGKKALKKKKYNAKYDQKMRPSATVEPKASENAEKLSMDTKTNIMRIKARKFLARHDYDRAANCYAGILQLSEGKGGFEAGELRRRCCLTLAECEIKVGNYEHAISLCTEVIDELAVALDSLQTPIVFSSENNTSYSSGKQQLDEEAIRGYLGKAHYRRGVSLAKLDLHEIAMLDLQDAHLYLPEDELILDRILAVQGLIDDRDHEDEMEDNESDLNSSESKGSAPADRQPLTQGELKEKLLDVIEEAQVAEARYLSAEALALLATEERHVSSSNFGAMPGLHGAGASAGGRGSGLGDMFGALGGMGGLGAGAGTGAGGLGALLGGLSRSGQGSKLPSLDSITAMLPMLGSMAGLSPDTIASGKEVLTAISHVSKVFYGMYKNVAPYKDLLIALLAGILIFISTRKQ